MPGRIPKDMPKVLFTIKLDRFEHQCKHVNFLEKTVSPQILQ